jgi:hypothetical protein
LAQSGMGVAWHGIHTRRPSAGHGNSTQHTVRQGKKCMSRTSPTSSSQQIESRLQARGSRGSSLVPRKTPVSTPNQGFRVPTRPRKGPNTMETKREHLRRFLLYCLVWRASRITSNQQSGVSQPGPSVGADDATAECRRPPHWPRGACTCTRSPVGLLY